MRFSQLFSRTLRDDQKEADVEGHNLLLRAGYVRQLAAGIFSYLHFGQRCMRKLTQIIREEMDGIGGDEICMPVVHPAEIWQETGRWYDIDDSMARFKDRNGRDMVLAMTHEEVVAFLASKEIETYKQLPKLVYQIYTKFRDEPRSRGGLIRVREFTMKDSYSLDTDAEGLFKQYKAHYDAYFRMYARAGLPVISVLSDTGMMGGSMAHEYMYVTDIGEDTLFLCEGCGYRANKEVAVIAKLFPEENELPIEKVYTPDKKTIEELSEFLNVTAEKTAKVVFYYGTIEEEEKVIVAVLRGDHEAHPIKIQKLCGAVEMRIATNDEIISIGCVAGYASPIGVDKSKSVIIVDDYIVHANNLVGGANEDQYHFLNVCYGRDYTADIVGDIIAAYDGAPCTCNSDQKLKAVRGVEVGNIFQLGTKYTEALDATYMDVNGKPQPIVMGSYGIGVGRLLACLAEEYRDDNGLRLPISVAPYHVHLVGLLDKPHVKEEAERLYLDLRNAGVEVLYDDRTKKEASPGVKFGDADLIGIPIRLTVAHRSLEKGGIEMKLRNEEQRVIISREDVVTQVKKTIDEMKEDQHQKLDKVEYWKGE